MKLVVGLGNPGNEYKKTRHNVGFMVLDSYLGEVHWSNKFKGLYYEKNINGEKYVFLKPQTYMNLSGISVSSFVKFYKLTFKDVLIIHDDLDLPFGKIRIKTNSSAGGHNGIKSIINRIGNNNFARLKIGISHNIKGDTKDFVLGKFNKEQLTQLEKTFILTNQIIEDFINYDINKVMNDYNGVG